MFPSLFASGVSEQIAPPRRRVSEDCDWYDAPECEFRAKRDDETSDEYYEAQDEWERPVKPKSPPSAGSVDPSPTIVSLKGKLYQTNKFQKVPVRTSTASDC